MTEPLWDRAALPVRLVGTRRRAEIVSLGRGLPDLATLLTFMRDAELRFASLRMRIVEVTRTAVGERTAEIDVSLRHPGLARVTTRSGAEAGAPGHYETWLSDGATVQTYASDTRVSTVRPLRQPPRGVDGPDLPGRARVYPPLTQLPRESLPDTFIHPAGFCQNVLATGELWVAGGIAVGEREGVAIECDHPRSVLVSADRPDHHLSLVADRETGLILRLVQWIGGVPTRDARVTALEPDAPLADSVFRLEIPVDARRIY